MLTTLVNCLQAISILDGINDEEVRHKPAVLATLLALQEQQQDLAGAIQRVQEGLQWWQGSMTAHKGQKAAAQTWLLQQLVQLQLKTGTTASQIQHMHTNSSLSVHTNTTLYSKLVLGRKDFAAVDAAATQDRCKHMHERFCRTPQH